jgi:transposase
LNHPTFCELYASEDRPSVSPEQLMLESLLQAFCKIRSGRLLLEQLHYNLLFHWTFWPEISTIPRSPRTDSGSSMPM